MKVPGQASIPPANWEPSLAARRPVALIRNRRIATAIGFRLTNIALDFEREDDS